MWKWLDPIECRIAQQCLAHGQTLEAAKYLLAGPHREHRAVRELLLRIGPELVAQAQQAFDVGDLPIAQELIGCAAQCGELPPAAQALQQEIVRCCRRQQHDQQWRERRLQAADAWAGQGRLQSALGLIEPLADGDPDAARRKQDWTADAARLEGYVHQFDEYLAQGRWKAAEAVLRKAQEAAPGQPQVLCMEQALDEARPAPARSPSTHTDPATPMEHTADPVASGQCVSPSKETVSFIAERANTPASVMRLLLAGLPGIGPVLILRQPVVLVGTANDPSVQLPLQAMLHRRHAMLVRDKTCGERVQFRVGPMSGCAVSVNHVPIPDGQTQVLSDGDVLQFANEHCRWTFRQPETGACRSSAVLQQTRPASAYAVAPGGAQVRCIVLAGDELVIGRDRMAAHLAEAGLPVPQLRLAWQAGGLYAHVAGGALFVNGTQADPAKGIPVGLPAELDLYADGDRLAGEALLGAGGLYEMKLLLQGDPHA
ncbi:MAG: FHA domain-containing protein [Pirellulaceae bacterium]|nr:FHA domain-containing protein [Pirellulaceae bacterium]